MISVSKWDGQDDAWIVAELHSGRAVSCYVGDYRMLKKDAAETFPMADVWYSERNGDPIALYVPKGTPETELPDYAQDYNIFEWIDPDKDFGTGYKTSSAAA